MKSTHRTLAVISLLTMPLLLNQGCGQIKDAAEAAQAASEAASSSMNGNGEGSAIAQQSADQLTNLAYKYADLKSRSMRDYEMALNVDSGCAVANEYAAAVEQQDLTQNVREYCDYLNSEYSVVRDCKNAVSVAQKIAAETESLSQDCAYVYAQYGARYGYNDTAADVIVRDHRTAPPAPPQRRPDTRDHRNHNYDRNTFRSRASTIVEDSIKFVKALGLDIANSRRDGRGRRY